MGCAFVWMILAVGMLATASNPGGAQPAEKETIWDIPVARLEPERCHIVMKSIGQSMREEYELRKVNAPVEEYMDWFQENCTKTVILKNPPQRIAERCNFIKTVLDMAKEQEAELRKMLTIWAITMDDLSERRGCGRLY